MNKAHDEIGIDRIDLNLFRVFDVVYREGNLTRAAARLHLSQSAVSHALARLRDNLGDPLFVREGRGVVPTPLAQRLAPVVQQSLEDLRRSIEGDACFDPRHDAHVFWINLPEQMEPLWLPALVAHMQTVAPRVSLRFSNVHWAQVQAEMQAGRIDVAIEITRTTDARLRQKRLTTDHFCVIASAGFEGDMTPERYLAAEHVAISSRRRSLCAEDIALGQLGLIRNVRQHCLHYVSAALLVAQSELLLTAPERLARLINGNTGNQIFPMPLPLSSLTLSLYWPHAADTRPAHQWLRQELATVAEAL